MSVDRIVLNQYIHIASLPIPSDIQHEMNNLITLLQQSVGPTVVPTENAAAPSLLSTKRSISDENSMNKVKLVYLYLKSW